MKELSTEQVVEIRDEVFHAENPRAKAEELAGLYGAEQVGEALQIANSNELPANNINAKKKRGPKPGTKKSPKPKPPVCETAPAKPKAVPKTVVLTAESAKIVADYLEGSLTRDIREGLGGDWTLNQLRQLLYAQNMMATYGEG